MLKQYRLKNYHFQLVVYIIALSIIGILLIGSAKHSVQSKQIIGFVMGLTIMIVLSLIDYSFLLKFVWIYYAVMILLLLLVLFAGDDAKGAQLLSSDRPGIYHIFVYNFGKVFIVSHGIPDIRAECCVNLA